MAGMLGRLYRAADEGAIPGETAPEVAEVLEASGVAAGRRDRPVVGQGFRPSAAEKDAIERHAVTTARLHYESEGWEVEDVGRKPVSYDLHLTRGSEERRVEVKGTTSLGEQVVLTRKEVDRQRGFFPDNALVVVRNIVLDRSSTPATAAGGDLIEVHPWAIDDDDLTIVGYIYRTSL